MKFTLKGYQVDAVRDALTNLAKARRFWVTGGDRSAFSLSAVTGAGKTVMAASVFEALFRGDEEFDFAADPGAVVLWFSDDPNLNEQTRFRILEASDRLDFSDLVVVPTSFSRAKFKAGKIYFLNTQKLNKNSLLVSGFDERNQEENKLFDMRPDGRAWAIWDTIQNTIDDPNLTLYLVIDEAHRGMSSTSRQQNERSTIVQRLINGENGVPPIPIVWGISATVERFNDAMEAARSTGRLRLPDVSVDALRVQESGLLKDIIALDFPGEAGAFERVLVRRATEKLRESTSAWNAYAKTQPEADIVTPLLVLQVENTPDPADIGRHLDTIFQEWPDLPVESVAHVFGDHTGQQFGPYAVPYISPEQVQDSTWVRVLIAKDAISTGWDCPRAEVMVSFRPAQDKTHITQLLGRMVRTPLARRIPGDDRLNAVDCLLPFFNEKTTKNIADNLMLGENTNEEVPGRRVLIDPVEMIPNESLPRELWDKFMELPSTTLPRKDVKPVKRLTALAQELSNDGLLADAGKKAHQHLYAALDSAQVLYRNNIERARNDVFEVEGRTLVANLADQSRSLADFVEEANAEVIEDAFRRASRVLSADVARGYAEHLAASIEADSNDDALFEAHAQVAALGLVPEVKTHLEEQAVKRSNEWLSEYRIAIKALSDDRRDVYSEIREMSTEPQNVDLLKPKNRLESTRVRQTSGEVVDLPKRQAHLLADAQGNFPIDMNEWEVEVLDAEMARESFVGWYRNPSRASDESLAIAYQDGQAWRALRPDFIFFSRRANGDIGASIVDPHGHHLGDALPKLVGLANYAETYGSHFDRIDAISKVDGKLRLLDMTEPTVRAAVLSASDVKSLYSGTIASDY